MKYLTGSNIITCCLLVECLHMISGHYFVLIKLSYFLLHWSFSLFFSLLLTLYISVAQIAASYFSEIPHKESLPEFHWHQLYYPTLVQQSYLQCHCTCPCYFPSNPRPLPTCNHLLKIHVREFVGNFHFALRKLTNLLQLAENKFWKFYNR